MKYINNAKAIYDFTMLVNAMRYFECKLSYNTFKRAYQYTKHISFQTLTKRRFKMSLTSIPAFSCYFVTRGIVHTLAALRSASTVVESVSTN